MKAFRLARRDLLRRLGLGAACLPLLRAPRARAGTPRRHLVIVQMSQGYRQAYWRPATGSLLTQPLPPTLEPFGDFKDDLIVLPGLTNPGAGAAGRGAYGVMFYGLGVTGTGPYREPTGATLDQIVGRALPAAGGRPSVNLGVMLDRAPQATTMPGGKFCFWAGAGQPIEPVGDPYVAYRDLFAAPGIDTPEVRRLILRRKSILDYVGTDLEEYGKRVGTPERETIDAHLQSIRDLERQLPMVTQSASCSPSAPPSPPINLTDYASYPRILDLHVKLMVAALKCGITNVATLQLSDAAAGNVNLAAFIPGLPNRAAGYATSTLTWRDVGHNPVMGGVDLKKIVDRWFMARIADLLAQLRAATEDGVSLLDDTLVLIGNPVDDGSNGSAQRIPWMLAGTLGGALNAGNCLASEGHPIASVMAGICEALGVTRHPYGEVLPGLKRV
jgi:hypothetical protein